MHLADLQTPCLLIDRTKLRRNLNRMSARARKLGVDLRPHLKTTKSSEVAKLATEGHSGAITVSTLREAEYFADAGYRDILYAVCVTPNKLDRVARLTNQGVQLTVIVDSVEAAHAVAQHPGVHFAMVEVDCGEDRTGLKPDDEALVTCAKHLCEAERVGFRGVVTTAVKAMRRLTDSTSSTSPRRSEPRGLRGGGASFGGIPVESSASSTPQRASPNSSAV